MKWIKGLVLAGLFLASAGSSFFTWFLFQLYRESAISFQIGRESFELAKKRVKETSSPEKGLAMTYESLEKLKSEQYNQRWLAQWDRKGQVIARKLSQQGKILIALSDKGLKEAQAKNKDLVKSRKLSHELLKLQQESLKLAREMKASSEKLLPISEALPKLIP